MKARTGFSYVQILVIVAVLGMVARLSAPRFVGAGDETKLSELIDGLEQMRSHLDLYRVHHNGLLPAANSFSGFGTAMTTRAGRYQPHIGKIPVNPFNGLDTIRFDGEPAGCGKAGWRLDTKSGLFQADNSLEYAAL
ncbi:MAG: hypothetical protein ACYS4W_10360 [Planctomycetota bacterium]